MTCFNLITNSKSTLAFILSHEDLVEWAAAELVHLHRLLQLGLLNQLALAVLVEPLHHQDRLHDDLWFCFFALEDFQCWHEALGVDLQQPLVLHVAVANQLWKVSRIVLELGITQKTCLGSDQHMYTYKMAQGLIPNRPNDE